MKVMLNARNVMIAGLVTAAPFAGAAGNGFEARSDAMGGTGVAAMKPGMAPLANPALLAKVNPEKTTSVTFPAIGAQASDSDHLLDQFKTLRQSWKRMDRAISSGDPAQAGAELKASMQEVAGSNARADAGMATVMSLTNDTLPVALFINSWGTATVRTLISQNDLDWLDQVSSGNITPGAGDLDQLTSRAEGVAALITEYGVSFAQPYTLANIPVAVGITPKIQRIETWNYNVGINNYKTSDFDEGNWQRQEMSANIDTGIYADVTPNWTLGLAAKNIIPHSVKTRKVNGSTARLEIRPAVKAGAAWTSGATTLTSDFDLSPVSDFTGIDKRQYVAAGVEQQVSSWARLRAGIRVDMRGNDHRVATTGVGFSPTERLQFDLTAIVGSERTIGGVAQLNYSF